MRPVSREGDGRGVRARPRAPRRYLEAPERQRRLGQRASSPEGAAEAPKLPSVFRYSSSAIRSGSLSRVPYSWPPFPFPGCVVSNVHTPGAVAL